MYRETEWLIAAIGSAFVAAALFAAAWTASSPWDVWLLVGSATLAAAAAVLANVWGYAVPERGYDSVFAGSPFERWYTRFRTWRPLSGVIALWLIAAAAVMVVGFFPEVGALAVAVLVVSAGAAIAAWVWGDIIQHDPEHT